MDDDIVEPFRLYDTKERAFVNQKEYKSHKTASQAAERKNQEYGGHRYSAEKYSDIVNRNERSMSKPVASGGGGGGAGTFNMTGGKPGVSPSSDNLLNFSKGGLSKSASKRADGIAQRGKTRGKLR